MRASGGAVARLLAFAVIGVCVAEGLNVSSVPERWTYWSNDEIAEYANLLASENPARCRAASIGKSAKGQDILVLSATTKPGVFLNAGMDVSGTPSFLYIGNMHGNEPLGRQLMVYMAEELCASPGKAPVANPAIRRILSSGVVHLLFTLNPDGFDLRRRENANGVDLNRNFPDAILGSGNMTLLGTEEPESLAIAGFASRLGSSLVGASLLHEGALVVNYPLDGAASGSRRQREPNPSRDDALYRYLAQRYIDVQPELQSNEEFPGGKIQGSMWYPVYGGLQDYLYRKHNVYTTTVEMNDQKWPPEAQLGALWRQHRASMYAFLDAYLCQGITVKVKRGPDDLRVVEVAMVTEEMGRLMVFSGSLGYINGDPQGDSLLTVHYPVPPGEYDLQVNWVDRGDTSSVGDRQLLHVKVEANSRTTVIAERPAPVVFSDPLPPLPPNAVDEPDLPAADSPSSNGDIGAEPPRNNLVVPGDRRPGLETTQENEMGTRGDGVISEGMRSKAMLLEKISWRRSQRANEIQQASYVSTGLMIVLFVAIVVLAALRSKKSRDPAQREGRRKTPSSHVNLV